MENRVLLDTVPKIKEFVDIANHVDCDIDLKSGRATYLDAKSLLGILSCNTSEPIEVQIHDDGVIRDEFYRKIEKFMVK